MAEGLVVQQPVRSDDLPLWRGTLNGQEFEQEFLKEFMSHPVNAGDCATKPIHPELRELCQRVAPRQKLQPQRLKE